MCVCAFIVWLFVAVKRKLAEKVLVLPPYRFWRQNLGAQFWWKTPASSKRPYQPFIVFLYSQCLDSFSVLCSSVHYFCFDGLPKT